MNELTPDEHKILVDAIQDSATVVHKGRKDMNERIRELSKQAGDYVNETYTGPVRSKTPGKIWEDGHVGWHTQFNQKFAELLIQQCINVCEPVLDEPYEDMSEFGKGLVEGQDVAVEKIKKHFGVEE